MRLPLTHSSLRYTGRWDLRNPDRALTVNPGSYFELGFQGDRLMLEFDCERMGGDRPALWLQVDDGPRFQCLLENRLRVAGLEDAVSHRLKVVFRSTNTTQSRWTLPLVHRVELTGIEIEQPRELAPDPRAQIEFVGDSITEGTFLDQGSVAQEFWVHEKDACEGYAWLTAENLGLRPIITAFGAQGMTHGGRGETPKAEAGYSWKYEGCPLYASPEDKRPEYIVLNQGANDRFAPAEDYVGEYRRLLETVRKLNPDSRLFVLSAFVGCHIRELDECVSTYNRETGDRVVFLNSEGWVPPEPLHPVRKGHRLIADRLSDLLRSHI